LSESSPTAREDAIEQMMQQRPGRRDQIFYSGKKMAAITGLPTSWLQQNQERQRSAFLSTNWPTATSSVSASKKSSA